MFDFTSMNCGVVINPGQENEQKLLFLVQDKDGYEYTMSVENNSFVSVKHLENDSYELKDQDMRYFLSEAFLYLCKKAFESMSNKQ